MTYTTIPKMTWRNLCSAVTGNLSVFTPIFYTCCGVNDLSFILDTAAMAATYSFGATPTVRLPDNTVETIPFC